MIAALVIASMGILAPTTTVTVNAALPTVTLTPSTVQDNGYVLFTLTVTNPADSGENVENILIKDVSTGTTANFGGEAIFGENVAENIDNVVDNLHEASDQLKEVAENLRNARTKLTAAADALAQAASWLENGGLDLQTSGRENLNSAGASIRDAASDLDKAATSLKEDPVNLSNVRENLVNAVTDFRAAANQLAVDNEVDSVLPMGAENIDNLATVLQNVAENLEGTWFWGAAGSDNAAASIEGNEPLTADNGLYTAALYLANFADNILENYTGTGDALVQGSAADKIDNAAEELMNVVENLRQVSENILAAGEALSRAENHLENAENILAMPGKMQDDNGPDDANKIGLLQLISDDFYDNIKLAAEQITLENENLLTAGSYLENAIKAQNIWLGTALASNIIGTDGEVLTNTARYWLGIVAAGLVDNDNIGLTEAANALDNAATRLSDGATKISTTKGDLTPTTGWGVQSDAGGLLLMSLGEGFDNSDNGIKPGESKTFKFLWKAPDLDTVETHTIRVWTLDNDNDVLTQNDFTLTVDGEPAHVAMRVYQTGVVDYLGNAVDNVVGKRLNDNKAVLEIKASKALSSLNTIKIENWKADDDENLELSFSQLTTTDNILFTYEIDLTNWTDNAENVRVYIAGPSSTTSTGVENENSAEMFFVVDLVDPVFAALSGAGTDAGGDNGLEQFEELAVIHKMGTDNEFYVTYQLTGWTIKGRAEDNDNAGGEGWEPGDNPDNDLWAITVVYVNGVAQTMTRLPDDNYNASVTLQEGINTIRVLVKDRVGNAVENVLENVYVDNTRPTVQFVSVGGKAWTENELQVSDNKVTIRLKIYDTGFAACTGLGIPRQNRDTTAGADNSLWVYLSQAENLSDDEAAIWLENLENSFEWDNGAVTADYNFENIFDNDNKGLLGGTWYVVVIVNDNVHDNDNHVMSFVIDVTAPSAPAGVAGSVTAGATAAARTVITTTSISLSGTAEVGATIVIQKSTDNGVTWENVPAAQATVDSSGNWTTSLSVTEGAITGIRVRAVDSAGNESTATLFGYVLTDSTSPTVAITSPATGITTDAASIAIQGTVTKDAWESWANLTLTVQIGTASVTVPISNGSFSYSVALAEGTNTIMASVTDGVNTAGTSSVNITRTVTPWATYAIIIVIVALILAAIAIFRKR